MVCVLAISVFHEGIGGGAERPFYFLDRSFGTVLDGGDISISYALS